MSVDRGGYTCYASVNIWAGPLAMSEPSNGRAGGGGYDKRSAAIADAFYRFSPGLPLPFDGSGARSMEGWVQSQGYEVEQAL
jgi:hypothetical protein